MTKDGAIYRITRQEGQPAEISDLEGKPFVDPKTGLAPEWDDFNRRLANPIYVSPRFRDRADRDRWYNDALTQFLIWRITPDTLWYYWTRYERLVGYDRKTRQFIGSLGPAGFSRDLRGSGDRFDAKPGIHVSIQRHVIYGPRTIYEPDPEHREVKALFTATNENCAAARFATNQLDRTLGAVQEVRLNGYDWNYTVVVTPCFIRLLAPDGRELWRTAYEPAYPEYSEVEFFGLEPTNRFALWISPSWRAQKKAEGKLPAHIAWLDQDGKVLNSTDLPELSHRPFTFTCQQKLPSLVMPPALYVLLPSLTGGSWAESDWWVLAIFSLTAAVVCLPIGWWFGRRYGLPLPARLGWAVFHLCFGVPGLLTELSVEEWPARETCPACKRLRGVDREKCPHCGAEFPPPEKTGAEVFEPLAEVK